MMNIANQEGDGAVPVCLVPPRDRRPQQAESPEARQRRGLLAMVHVAKKQLGLSDDEYEMFLTSFKVDSAGSLSIRQLENMVELLKHHGWKHKKSRKAKDRDDRLSALRRRCVEIAQAMENGEKRMAGLAAKICGVATIAWCKDADKLERLLAVLGSIKEKEQ